MPRHLLPIFLRAYAVPKRKRARTRSASNASTHASTPWPDSVLVFDTETRIDPTQQLLFGSYQYCRWNRRKRLRCVEEGLVYDDALPERDPEGFRVLQSYVKSRNARRRRQDGELRLLSRQEFVNDRFWKAIKAGTLIVGFNLPFDLTRLAVDVGPARGDFYGGFSCTLFEYHDRKSGTYRTNPHGPRLCIKTLDSKRAFYKLTTPREASEEQYEHWRIQSGRFVDLRTLVYALTGEAHSLDSACEVFGLSGKARIEKHGVITPKYIDYNRRDVGATVELLERVRVEFDRHPIHLEPGSAFSPAALAKAYLHAMGITPPAGKFENVSPEAHGIAMTAYYGGRSEVRIRKVIMPVVHLDFLSMYPTVNALLGTWSLLTAADVVIEDATDDVRDMLHHLTVDRCFAPAMWQRLCFFALIEPREDILPLRGQYNPASTIPGIGINVVSGDGGLWYAGPDVVASTILTGRPPRVLQAFRLVPKGRQSGLRSVKLRGSVPVSPRRDDFFKCAIEAREALPTVEGLSAEERKWRRQALKILANSGGYGVNAEMNRNDIPRDKPRTVAVYGLESPFECSTHAPEKLGRFCFPPLAALTTAGARLMLALLERCVTDRDGIYAFGDTDSMAIVATPTGGYIRCNGGPHRHQGAPAVRALSWAEVDAMVERFAVLNPYDPDRVRGSILKIEKENFDAEGLRRQLYVYAISAKRYVLFTYGPTDEINIAKPSEHGLGHLRDPLGRTLEEEQDSEPWPRWIEEAWLWILEWAHGRKPRVPAWFKRPAVSRVTVSRPALLDSFAELNQERPYADQIKPMNFVLSVQVARFGHPDGVEPTRFHLLAPFERDPSRWLAMPWLNKYSGKSYRIGVGRKTPPDMAQVVTYGGVIREYRAHPEAKSAGPSGRPCGRKTTGLLRRRKVHVGPITYLGKESNRLDDVERGLVHDLTEVRAIYADARLDPWQVYVVPVLKRIPAKQLAKQTGLSVRAVKALRNGKARPSARNRDRLIAVATEWAKGIVADPSANERQRQSAERLLAWAHGDED